MPQNGGDQQRKTLETGEIAVKVTAEGVDDLSI